jgi:nitrogen fixation protein
MRSFVIRSVVFLAAVLCLSGCAQVQVKRLSVNDVTTEGVRYYAPQAYLLVTMLGDAAAEKAAKAGESKFQSQIIWLPKINEQYAVQVKSGWGTAEGSVKLQNGWMLAEFGSTTDSKGPETIEAFSGVIKDATGLLKVTAPGGGSENVLGAGLYRIEFDPNTGYISKFVPVRLQ